MALKKLLNNKKLNQISTVLTSVKKHALDRLLSNSQTNIIDLAVVSKLISTVSQSNLQQKKPGKQNRTVAVRSLRHVDID